MTPSNEVNTATGAAPDLDERIATLEGELAVPTERETKAATLADLKRKKTTHDAAALLDEAKAYVIGEVRAISSLVGEPTTLDGTRLLAAAEAFRDEALKLDERFGSILARRHSLRAVVVVFGLPTPELPQVTPPALRTTVQEAFAIMNAVFVRDHGFTQPTTDNDGRRTFEEPELSEPARALLRRKGGQG